MSTKQLHKKWRKEFNEVCLKRDKNKCVFCNERNNLDVHHIVDRHEMPNGGYVLSNGITLCSFHHLKCESYHMNNVHLMESEYHPNELFKIIGSSYKEALNDSEKLI
jgi:hypothetical protein